MIDFRLIEMVTLTDNFDGRVHWGCYAAWGTETIDLDEAM